MRQTLPEALDAIFGTQSAVAAEPATETATAPSTSNPTAAAVPASQRERVEAAIAAYEQGQEALQKGDWAAYGQSQERLGSLLQELNGKASDDQ